jgi:hypothetical protein
MISYMISYSARFQMTVRTARTGIGSDSENHSPLRLSGPAGRAEGLPGRARGSRCQRHSALTSTESPHGGVTRTSKVTRPYNLRRAALQPELGKLEAPSCLYIYHAARLGSQAAAWASKARARARATCRSRPAQQAVATEQSEARGKLEGFAASDGSSKFGGTGTPRAPAAHGPGPSLDSEQARCRALRLTGTHGPCLAQ